MKKLLLLSLCLVLLLSGCGGKEATAATTAATTVATEPVETTPTYPAPYREPHTLHYYFFTTDGMILPELSDYRTRWGEACLVAFPNGEYMLIDTGLESVYPTLRDWLHEQGVNRIDYLMLTHTHRDHIGGALSGMLDDFEIGMIYHNGVRNDVLQMGLLKNMDMDLFAAGSVLTVGEGEDQVTVTGLWPSAEYQKTSSSYAMINSQSMVFRIQYGEHSSLFTGCIYKTYKGVWENQIAEGNYHISDTQGVEEQLAELYTNGELDVDLLKLPTHGDPSTSNSKELFDATTAEIAVATGFLPLESGYTKAYTERGFEGTVLFDRLHGFITIYATADGNMEYETSRDEYLEDFGKKWNSDLEH